jgi:hypothetical protein
MYFSFFPKQHSYPVTIVKGDYTSQYSGELAFDDLFRNVALANFNAKKNSLYFQREQILNGERPDQVSMRLYGTPNYFWTFFIINEHLRLGENLQWPMDENHLRKKIANDYEGKALIAYKTRYILGFKPKLAFLKNNTVVLKSFQKGETIIGQSSGAHGELRVIRNDVGQLVVKLNTIDINFNKEEQVYGTTSGSSIFVHDIIEYQDAPMYYVDEEGRECSHPNFIQMHESNLNETMFTPISFKEHWFKTNEELSNIRVLQKSSLLKFEDSFRTLINKRRIITK